MPIMAEPREAPATDESGSSPWPILAALTIVVVVVIGIWLFNAFGGEKLSDEQQVARAAVGQNDALERASYPDFRTYTCGAQQGVEADVLAHQRDSVAKKGARYVDGVSGVAIDGDRASAAVTYHFGSAPDAKSRVDMTFVREDGAWKVCSTGPG
jgi:hypothetical protein